MNVSLFWKHGDLVPSSVSGLFVGCVAVVATKGFLQQRFDQLGLILTACVQLGSMSGYFMCLIKGGGLQLVL